MRSKWIIRTRFNKEYEKFIRSKPCLICNRTPVDFHHVWHSRNDSYVGVPLCREHHSFGSKSYHYLEHNAFEKMHNICFHVEIFELLTEFLEIKMAQNSCIDCDEFHNETKCPKCGSLLYSTDENFNDEHDEDNKDEE